MATSLQFDFVSMLHTTAEQLLGCRQLDSTRVMRLCRLIAKHACMYVRFQKWLDRLNDGASCHLQDASFMLTSTSCLGNSPTSLGTVIAANSTILLYIHVPSTMHMHACVFAYIYSQWRLCGAVAVSLIPRKGAFYFAVRHVRITTDITYFNSCTWACTWDRCIWVWSRIWEGYIIQASCMYMYCLYIYISSMADVNLAVYEILEDVNLIYVTFRVGQWLVDTYHVGRVALS